MKENLKNTLSLLRSEVSKKLKEIKKNESLAREILNNDPSGSDRSERLKKIYDENKKMLEENNELLKMQHLIVGYMSKYLSNIPQTPIPEAIESQNEQEAKHEEIVLKRPVDKDALFMETINGELTFNELHPLYEDEEFFNKLMNHYIEIEAYEKCEELQQFKSFKNQLN